ncbi:LysR family transcriptional regulator [Pseudomonas sp. 14P_8.1_Bac3]|uniref:LysR family transcriptional regulator n=1 Tax=Pseudomonas sp. 14P_8.1_Bac3 TaxID=2971621 RepID=UPI0021C7FF6F|nr:LysR family transcriptional regulator [Pseudomonas sp. 14P_8.1_Bac3]MCU1760182.1 LysR family transcriptional regulator [Pseudomonas sp. 14P_8.1_Bac3]
MAINEENFHDVDLNLMVTFLVLYRELSVTRAATLMKVGQPAVSGSLARLRTHFDDPLFLRTGRGVRPTNKAIEIAESLLPALSRIETVLTSNLHRVSDGEKVGQQ